MSLSPLINIGVGRLGFVQPTAVPLFGDALTGVEEPHPLFIRRELLAQVLVR